MVAHLDQHPVFAALGGNVHVGDGGVHRLAIAACVLQQVGNHARQFHLVRQHVEVFRDLHGDLQLAVVLHRVNAGRHYAVQVDGGERDVVGACVIKKLVDGGVKLHDVGHHVLACDFIHHAHFGFEPQARQRRAQVVRNAGQHDGAVLLQLGKLLCHAVEADVHFADFTGHRFFVEAAGGEITIAHAVGGIRKLLERPVDQPGNGSSAGQRKGACRDEPDQPGAAAGGAEARAVHQQPVGVAIDVETNPQAIFSVHVLGHDGVRAQALGELVGQAVTQCSAVEQREFVARLARQDAHPFLVGHGFDERHARDGIRVHQRCTAEVDQRRNLLGRVQRARLKLQGAQRLQPGKDAAHQQQRQQEKGAPEQVQPHARTLLARAAQGLQGGGTGGVGRCGHRLSGCRPAFGFAHEMVSSFRPVRKHSLRPTPSGCSVVRRRPLLPACAGATPAHPGFGRRARTRGRAPAGRAFRATGVGAGVAPGP